MAKKENDNVALQELKAAIKAKNIGNLYFFHGEETFLLHHYLEQLRKKYDESVDLTDDSIPMGKEMI